MRAFSRRSRDTIAVVDIDPDTAVVKVRRFIAVDDCGVRINPMIVEGQVHRGLADGIGIALMPFGVRHADMPLTPANVWSAIQGNPLRTDLALP